MTEPKYTRTFANWDSSIGFNGATCCATRDAAESFRLDGDTTIELIPLPEHESIVAAAVAAERERCAGIADAVEAETMPVNRSFRDHFEHERGDTAAEIARKIREVTT